MTKSTRPGSAVQALALFLGTIGFVAVCARGLLAGDGMSLVLVRAGGAALILGLVAVLAGSLAMAVLREQPVRIASAAESSPATVPPARPAAPASPHPRSAEIPGSQRSPPPATAAAGARGVRAGAA